MGDDSFILREDGYIRMNFPVTSLTYHSNLNIILVKSDVGGVHVLDVNSGVILQSSCLSADVSGNFGVEYAAGADRVFVWDNSGVGARTDYNGVLLLHTILQRPLPSSQTDKKLKIELVLSEAILLYQCLQSLDVHSIDGLSDFINELKNAIDTEPVRKGVKAQKWSTVTIRLPQSTVRLVTSGVVQDLKGQNRRIPALAIASAVGQRANELVPCSRDEDTRPIMYSEAERKETFKRWPHMDYKWALPARMAQAGFYHQPSPSGDDRAMCFMCMVCLVCWEKSDEPWVEHERHSPNCPFVRGEYTHNVPISVTNATACAVPCSNVTIVSKGNTGDLIATGTSEGKANIWKFDCGLKLVKYIHLSPYDSIFSGILSMDSNKVWSTSIEKDTSTYGLELTAMSFIGMTLQQEVYPQTQSSESTEKDTSITKTKPSLICAVTITRTNCSSSDQSIKDDSSKALFDSGSEESKESVQAMNDQNEAKSNLTPSNKMLFLLTYDIFSSLAGSITTVVHTSNSSGNSKPGGSKKVCTLTRADDTANIYDEIYFQYSDEDTELPQCPNSLIDEHISNVINLNASSSKEDSKLWEPKKILFPKQFKVVPAPGSKALLPEPAALGPGCMLDFVGKMSQLKSWKSGNLESVGTKLADQTDAVLQQGDPITHYLSLNGPLEISDLKWYEGGEGVDKVKMTTFGGSKLGTQTVVSNSNNDGFDSDPPQEEAVTQAIAVQCLSLPADLVLHDDSRVTHLLPTEDKEHLLVVISSIEPAQTKPEDETDNDGDTKMDVDDVTDHQEHVEKTDRPDAKAYFLLFKINKKTSILTLEDNPVSVKELPFSESPVDLCLLPINKREEYSFASVGVDGCLRLYSLPDFKVLSEKRVAKGQFTSVAFCASVERLSVSTKHGMIYFYALNNGEKDVIGDIDDDEFANIDFDMLQRAPHEEVSGSASAPVIIANKTELEISDLETLNSLTGSYGTNTTVPYSAVVPGFWCELSPAQRSRSDHQNNRTWRLQNTSSTWDEHVLEITLPYSVSLAHVEFSFTLHTACTVAMPIIQVTLLKQNLHGIGYKKDANFGQRSDSPVQFPVIDADMTSNLENPVNSEEYLQAHNAEILAGPLLLSSGLDLTQQSGSLILTSPRLYRARGRTFLIHLKTLFDPAKDMAKGPSKSGESTPPNQKKSGFIGCDWLHQISLTVRSCPHTDVPMERQQRIAMLESNSFLATLCEIAVNKGDSERKKLALDLLMWTVSIRLQRMRLAKSEKIKDKDSLNSVETQQLECIKIIEKYTDSFIKNCILCANRSISKKCVKVMLITSEGVKQLPKPWKSTFDQTLTSSLSACIPYLAACESPGALRWLVGLAQHASQRGATELVAKCLSLLEKTAKCLKDRSDVYHNLLKARFGLYGLPLERTTFAADVPELVRGTSTVVTYASVLANDTGTPPVAKQECQLKDLLNLPNEMAPIVVAGAAGSFPGSTPSDASYLKTDYHLRKLLHLPPQQAKKDAKTTASSNAWWAQNNGVAMFGAGVSEAMPLHVTCHVASDGTKLESNGLRHNPTVVSSMPNDPYQLWNVMQGSNKQASEEPDLIDDVESILMDCDPQEKTDFTADQYFKEQDQCGVGWAALVARPPAHTLVVERMHSGARRYIVLDFMRTVRLSDVIIPMCSELVTLCIDVWTSGEEVDSVKLALATDIATKHLVLTDMQPPPLCRYMKITTIGRYGMSAMKCKIPLGWFFGEIADIDNIPASISSLTALQQDLTCRFRLATGKLMDLLNPYLEMYNGNWWHMAGYLGAAPEPRVLQAYHECTELQHQLHTCDNVLRRLRNSCETNEHLIEMINKGKVTSESLLERASTDKLRVICENVVDMLLYLFYQVGDVQHAPVSAEWCATVSPLVWEWGGRACASLATLQARLCGQQPWWGQHVAQLLQQAFCSVDAPPVALDRVVVMVMYMCRKSSHSIVAEALAAWVSALVSEGEGGALPAALAVLSAVLDAGAAHDSRWDWVGGGRASSVSSGAATAAPSPKSAECKLHRKKLHRKLLHQMQELEAARRGIQVALEEQQRARFSLKSRMAAMSRGGAGEATRPRPLAPHTAANLAQLLAAHMLAMDAAASTDLLLLSAKVVGRLCGIAGGCVLQPACTLGLARRCVTLPPWPRHALTALLQDLVEYENGSSPASPPAEEGWGGARAWELRDLAFGKTLRNKDKGVSVADFLADTFGLPKTSKPSKPKNTPSAGPMTPNGVDMDFQLSQVVESDDSESEEKLEQYFLDAVKKETRNKPVVDNSSSNVSVCVDARLESGPAAASEALCRRVLLAGGGALAQAVRCPPPAPARVTAPAPARVPAQPPLAHTLYDVFRHLAVDLHKQMDCTLLENIVSLWLTLNGASGGVSTGSGSWAPAAPPDAPRVRLASDTVLALLAALQQLENVSLRCWVLSMQALAWVAILPLQTEGSSQTMGRVILESEHLVPCIVKFVTMDVTSDAAVTTAEPYLGGASVGGGAGAASALSALLSRVVAGRGAAGAALLLRCVCGAWRGGGGAPDLQAALLRAALPLLPALQPSQHTHAVQLIHTVAELSITWVSGGGGCALGGGRGESRGALGALGDALGGAAARRHALRRAVLAMLLHYCRKLLPLPVSPAGSSTSEDSQTDESKAQNSPQPDTSTNVEDERKQVHRTPCIADVVIQQPQIMHKFYKALSLCDPLVLNTGTEPAAESSLREEVFWLVLQMAISASNPVPMVNSLLDFLRKDEIVHLSSALQQLTERLLERPEALAAFIDAGGLQLSADKLTACHQAGPNSSAGLVSSLMSQLKAPHVSLCGKKCAPAPDQHLINIAPLCTVTCGNPTAQAADVLLGGGGGSGGAGGACAARRVRAAAWSYHFFSADDAQLALTLRLPHAALLHELQLQPHLTSLATCPGAVALEAGCGGTLVPLGPPQNTSGMTLIRLVLSRPMVCSVVQVRLYKPRDSSNMGLLQLRLMVAPAFSQTTPVQDTNNWAPVLAACTAGSLPAHAWVHVRACSGALCALAARGGAGGAAARALLHAARGEPQRAHHVLTALLEHADTLGYGSGSGAVSLCGLVRALCRRCPQGAAPALMAWLQRAPPRAPPPPSAVYTAAQVLWSLKEERLLDNVEELVTDDLFQLVYTWAMTVPETGLLKKSLDAILCSMCYIRPELFRVLLEQMNIPVEQDETMEGLTDDTKVLGGPSRQSSWSAWRVDARRLRTLAQAALSPAATHALLRSKLPQAAVSALAEFSEAKLELIKVQSNTKGSQEDVHMVDYEKESCRTKSELPSMSAVCSLVEFLRLLCAESRLQEWLGGAGAGFWKPLLRLLCYPRPQERSWQEGTQYAQLEEATIRLFYELTTCHAENQKLFALTLHSILESMQSMGCNGISGFTRALLLRLALSAPRCTVALSWARGAGAAGAAPRHPAWQADSVLAPPLSTTVAALLQHAPPAPVMDDPSKSGPSIPPNPLSVPRSASDTAIMTVADAWELSLAAASASKDKRVKDVKNSSLKHQNYKKRSSKGSNEPSVVTVADDEMESSIVVSALGIEGRIPGSSTLAQLVAAAPPRYGAHVTLMLHQPAHAESWSSTVWSPPAATPDACSGVLRWLGACDGLALLASMLPRPRAAPPAPPPACAVTSDMDWIKLDDGAEEVVEVGPRGSSSSSAGGAEAGVPAHALCALALLLKLPGYARALLDEGPRAVQLLRLLLGAAHDEDARPIVVGGGVGAARWSLGTLPFHVVARLLESEPLPGTLRGRLLALGCVRLLLRCLAVLTHHQSSSTGSGWTSGRGGEAQAQLYWAKGTGFGTGSTQQSWNVEQALSRQRSEEQHATQLLQVLASYMNPGEKWPPEEGSQEASTPEEDQPDVQLPDEFIQLVAESALVPALCSYLRNDSVLDMSRHIPLYVCVLRCARALHAARRPVLLPALRALAPLLRTMARTADTYAHKLRMSKKSVFGKMTYSQRFSSSSNSELWEEDEGLATLIADIQVTAALLSVHAAGGGSGAGAGAGAGVTPLSRDQRYIQLMRTMQFETFEMLAECADSESGFKFTVPYHFEATVRSAGSRSHPARMKRLAQEAATLATSLPLSYCSSVFVRTDTARLDVMKVLITGPSDTPYANGCFILDVYFPAEYPAVPMLINLATTGRHSVRFNPNLYNDGKVCLSVLNTWHGRPEEKWNAHTSSFLQVLVSIQSLILVPEPYFNEPGYERSRGTRVGSSASLEYNSNIYQACVRWAMLDQLRNPEPCFKQVIQTHFWLKRAEIMSCVAGWLRELDAPPADERTQRALIHNQAQLKRHYVKLQEELAKLPVPEGLEDLDEPFPPSDASAPPDPPAPPAPPTEPLDHDMEKIVAQVLD